MRHWKRVCARLANLFRKSSAETEMNREISAHLALIEEDFQRRGMTAAEATAAARRIMGGVEQTRELHRDARSFVRLEQALQDVRQALRALAGSRAMTLALVGIYGLISYSVTRRTRKVGIRMSIGAQRGDVLWLFLRETTLLLVAGMAFTALLCATIK